MGPCTVAMEQSVKSHFRIAAASFAVQDYRGTIEACRKALFFCKLQGPSALRHPLVVVHLRKMVGDSYLNLQMWSLSRQNYQRALEWIPPGRNFRSLNLEIRRNRDYVSRREANRRQGPSLSI